MDFETARKIVKDSPKLKSLEPSQQGLLLLTARADEFKAGDEILKEGDPARGSFLLLVSGKANVLSKDGKVDHGIAAGDLIGEIGVVNPHAKRTRTVTAAQKCEVLVWELSQIEKIDAHFAKRLSAQFEKTAFEIISQDME